MIDNDFDFSRGSFRVRGDVIDIFPAENSETALRVSMFDDEVETLTLFDPLTGQMYDKIKRVYGISFKSLCNAKRNDDQCYRKN